MFGQASLRAALRFCRGRAIVLKLRNGFFSAIKIQCFGYLAKKKPTEAAGPLKLPILCFRLTLKTIKIYRSQWLCHKRGLAALRSNSFNKHIKADKREGLSFVRTNERSEIIPSGNVSLYVTRQEFEAANSGFACENTRKLKFRRYRFSDKSGLFGKKQHGKKRNKKRKNHCKKAGGIHKKAQKGHNLDSSGSWAVYGFWRIQAMAELPFPCH